MKKLPILLLLSLGASLWFVPFFLDWVRYKNLPKGCAGVFTYEGKVGDESLSGRHCASGASISSNEAGFLVAFEFATGGQLMAYGKRQAAVLESRPCANASCDLSQALFRPAGDDSAWLCAAGGSYHHPGAELQLALSAVSALPTQGGDQTAEVEFSGGLRGKLTINQVAHKEAGLWGTSCAQDQHRCDFQLGQESAATRIFVRAAEAIRSADARELPLEDAFIIQEDARSPKQVTLMQAKPNSGSTISYDGTKLVIKLKGLSAPTACPAATKGTGSLTAHKK